MLGGGTDFPGFYENYGGLTITMSINLYQRILFDDNFEKSTYPTNGTAKFAEAFLKYFVPSKIKCESDIPLESGMGSSAAAGVALVGLVHKYSGINGVTRNQVAESAWYVETHDLGLFGGKQDQYAAAYGGLNVIEYTEGNIRVKTLPRVYAERLLPAMALFYLGNNRQSAKIQEGFKEYTEDQLTNLGRIKQLAQVVASKIPIDYKMLGQVMDGAWSHKKLTNKEVTNSNIDNLYDIAKQHGAIGGKVCGAGGGGFMFFIVEPTRKQELIEGMASLGVVNYDFDIDWNGLQTRILSR